MQRKRLYKMGIRKSRKKWIFRKTVVGKDKRKSRKNRNEGKKDVTRKRRKQTKKKKGQQSR